MVVYVLHRRDVHPSIDIDQGVLDALVQLHRPVSHDHVIWLPGIVLFRLWL